MAYGKLIWYLV